MADIHISFLVDAVQLGILPVQLITHVDSHSVQVVKDIAHLPEEEEERRSDKEEKGISKACEIDSSAVTPTLQRVSHYVAEQCEP